VDDGVGDRLGDGGLELGDQSRVGSACETKAATAIRAKASFDDRESKVRRISLIFSCFPLPFI
jgi:hypothetical protein